MTKRRRCQRIAMLRWGVNIARQPLTAQWAAALGIGVRLVALWGWARVEGCDFS